MERILERDEFRMSVFARDRGMCVMCGRNAKDAHHILDRSLWPSGGYYLSNGACLCEGCHILAGKCLPPQAIRRRMGLPVVPDVLPASLVPSKDYDLWGNELKMPPRKDIKYPKTNFLPFSPTSDARHMADINPLLGIPLVVTVKMDGNNVMLDSEKVAARNGDTASLPTFDYLKAIHAGLRHNIRPGIRIFGEWLYGRLTIPYEGDLALDGYLQVFSIFDVEYRTFLGWDEVCEVAADMGVRTTPVLSKAQYVEPWRLLTELSAMAAKATDAGHEGIVVRSALPFHYGQFGSMVAKYVREGHKQDDDTFMTGPLVRNKLKHA